MFYVCAVWVSSKMSVCTWGYTQTDASFYIETTNTNEKRVREPCSLEVTTSRRVTAKECSR
jgi:hypothetical protein